MKAKKCDRCGDFYLDGKFSICTGTITYETWVQTNSGRMIHDSDHQLDLCPECMETFLSFVRGDEL